MVFYLYTVNRTNYIHYGREPRLHVFMTFLGRITAQWGFLENGHAVGRAGHTPGDLTNS